MEVESLTVTLEDKQQPTPRARWTEGPGSRADRRMPRARAAKPAPERKRARNLSEDKRFKLFCGTANRPLAEEIGRHIGVKVGEAKLQRFADGEVYFQLLENVRGVDVFVVQPTCYPVDQHLVELLIMIDALKRASAARITVVVPYYGYARQDRKDRPRVAISAKLIADLLTTAGANRALFVDLHAAQIQGFFNIPVDHMFCQPGAGELFPRAEPAQPDGGFAGCGRRGAGAVLRAEDGRAAGHRGQAPHRHQRGRSDARGRRCARQDLPHHRRHYRHGRNAGEDRGCSVCERRFDGACLRQPRRAFGPGHRSHCQTRGSSRWLLRTRFRCAKRRRSLPKIKVLSIAGLLGAAIESIHMETSVSTLFS